ncbi:SPOR domain-containing protein [Endothiovibrio diazotrophicus]
MSRDYKNTTSRNKKPERTVAPAWLMLTTGLVVGLFIAALAWLATQPAGAPEHAVKVTPKPSPPPPKETPKPQPKPRPTPTAEAKKAPEKPKFEFYTILSEMETVVPPQELSAEVKEGVPQVKAPGTYMLQAGSFRTNEQADQLKAKIAFLGLSAEIQKVTTSGNETWHRVRLGPFSDLAVLNEARAKLKQQHIDALLLKVAQTKK